MAWRSISPDLAKQHPLYGVGGWLVFFIVFLVILILLISPLVQIAAKEVAGFSNPIFTPSIQWIGYFLLIWYIVKKKSGILTFYLIMFPGLSILGTIILEILRPEFSSLGPEFSSYLHFGPEDLILTVLVRDVPFALYLFNSRRVRVTFQHQVRDNDPILNQAGESSSPRSSTSEPTDVPNSGKRAKQVVPKKTQGGSARATAATSQGQKNPDQSKSVPVPEMNTEPKLTGQTPEPDTTVAKPMNTEETAREEYPEAHIVIRYDKVAAEQFQRLSELPEEFSDKFLEAVEADPRCDTKSVTDGLIEQHRKQSAPYEDERLNKALAEMREIGPEAEQEFQKAIEVIGEDRVDADFVSEQIRTKIKPPENVKDTIYILKERFGDRVKEVEDAISLLEALQFSIRSEDDGYDFYVEGPGYFLEKGPLKGYQLVAFANSRLREISNPD